MIDDGLTAQYKNCYYRPLGKFGKELVFSAMLEGDWDGLDVFLWGPPHFIGDEKSLTVTDKVKLWSGMVAPNQACSEKGFQELHDGLELFFRHPMLGIRDCDTCKKYWFDQDTGYVVMRGDEPLKRPDYAEVSCDTHAGCLKGHHTSPTTLSEVHQQILKHYLEWRHVGLDDESRQCPFVRRNWQIIADLVEEYGGLTRSHQRLLSAAAQG